MGQISEILNFHSIDLKLEQDFHKNDRRVSRGLAATLDLREKIFENLHRRNRLTD